ncbi:MAG: c-type cytochrome domain-containing protein, partial [Verrucomicrobiota bacterium]
LSVVLFFAVFLLSGAVFAQSPEQKLMFKQAYDVMEKHCFACHGAEKQKGGLRMDSIDALLKGGENSDQTLVRGHAEQSDMIQRIRLPEDDEDAMPPAKKKTRLTTREILALEQWVNDGAPWLGDAIGQPVSMAEVDEMHRNMGVDLKKPISPEDKAFFDKHIEPLLDRHCIGCHGTQKQKGGLRLDTKALAFAGGDNGPVLVPGKPDESELYVRMTLPMDDDDVMPPSEKARIDKANIAFVRQWIERGAPWPPPKSKLSRGGDNHYTKFMETLTPAQKLHWDDLKKKGVFMEPLIWKDGGIRVVLTYCKAPLDADLLNRLSAFGPQIFWLDLTKKEISPTVIDFLGGLNELSVLHLERSTIDDAGVGELVDAFPRLEYLNLHSTKVGDHSVEFLRRFKSLGKLYLWNTQFTEAGVEAVKEALPETKIYFSL